MENLKIRVVNEAESREAQEFFLAFGLKRRLWSKHMEPPLYICKWIKGEFSNYSLGDFGLKCVKEITLPELRDMVVLNRNDKNDANAFCRDNGAHYYISSNGEYYFFLVGDSSSKWDKSRNSKDYLGRNVEPIEKKEMKEFLEPHPNGKYVFIKAEKPLHPSWIEIPEGAEILAETTSGNIFYKPAEFNRFNYSFISDSGEWSGTFTNPYDEIGSFVKSILWKRETLNDKVASAEQYRQAEVLPFIDDEVLKLNTIEDTLKERQSTYGDFTFVANTTGKLMAEIMNGRNSHLLPYSHQEALHMICSKIARIVNGDCNYVDNWHDICGYSKLVEESIKEKMNANSSKD